MSYVYELLKYSLLAISLGVIVPLTISLILRTEKRIEIGIILLSLAVIGTCAGLSGGMSRTGAVGSIIPAFLSLLGGLSLYLFGIDRSKGLIASLGAISLAISLFVSYMLGSQFRNVGDDHRNIREHCALAYTNDELLGNETAFSLFRERLGLLCDRSMSWSLSGSSEM